MELTNLNGISGSERLPTHHLERINRNNPIKKGILVRRQVNACVHCADVCMPAVAVKPQLIFVIPAHKASDWKYYA